MKKIVVATNNPVKIRAVENAFQRMFPNERFKCWGKATPSGVPDQPMDDQETLLGAHNRASNCKTNHPLFDYWVGIEGGIEIKDNEMNAFAWIVILSKNRESKARSGTFYLPEKVMNLVISGMELGHADDQVFGQSNSKQRGGAVGLLTGDVIDRKKLYEEAVVLALIPFKNEALYNH